MQYLSEISKLSRDQLFSTKHNTMRRVCLGFRRMSTSAGEAWQADRFGVLSPASEKILPKPLIPQKNYNNKNGKPVYTPPEEIGAAEVLKFKKHKTLFAKDIHQILKLLGEKLYKDPDYILARHIPNQSLKRLSYAIDREGDPQDNLVALVVDLAMHYLEARDLASVEAALRHSEVFEDAAFGNYEEHGFSSYPQWLGYQIVSLAVSQNLLTAAIAMTSRFNSIFGPHPAVADLLFKAIAYHPLHKKAQLLKQFAAIQNLTNELDRQPSYVIEELMDWARFQQRVPTPANELAEFLLKGYKSKVSQTSFVSLLCQNLDNGNPWGAAYLWELYKPRDLMTLPPAMISSMLSKLTTTPELHYICRDIISNLQFDYTASLGASVIEFCAHTKQLELGQSFALRWQQISISQRPRHVLTALLHYAVVSRDSDITEELSQEIKRRDGRLSLYETQLLVTHMVRQSVEQGLEYISKMDEHVGMHMYAAVAVILRDSEPELALQCVREYQQFMARGGVSPDQHVIDSFAETQVHLVLNSNRPNATREALALIQEWVAFDGTDLRTLSISVEERPSRESRMRMLFNVIGNCERTKNPTANTRGKTRGKGRDKPVYEAAWEHLKKDGLGDSTIDFVLKH
ncbi:YALI0F01188p [Yarrowia lipolytica CLIB122]|uniref:YALI0F01188p n=2 Tax=Yarrowia lipolytica TaxID=4952 RepID=Q6C3A9_YARLI|nr:YALI0F01188p [Yarrowia lipolytica CLIB122]AOW06475.1 hypothetical protein YALI1_F01929g [Yarrowia lipolytica]KAJ8056266.1 hypothetical protein LXG23DRAFT_48176 [Yarrowia lipolytica]CAG77655.1 YALI0F01188p [Yarrowia lipolytica CLIB122]SEI32667.1 YALIA101S02e22892g1_1 [Yarrowia lipolytica]|eukprot:XP_504853.1 YALI0F01188p [Yarrowia lipolytica CLIB122]